MSTDREANAVSSIRNRDRALGILLPKFLGVLWRAPTPPLPSSIRPHDRLEVGGHTIHIDEFFAIGASAFGNAFCLHAYVWSPMRDWTKVFSAHVADPIFTKPKCFQYWGGRCAILSWKRGPWEDELCAQPDQPRSLAHVYTAGVTCKKPRLRLVG